MGRVLVTGAAGFIGSHLASALLDRGDSVVGLDNLNDFYDPELKRQNIREIGRHGDFTLLEGDIRDPESVETAFDLAGEGASVIHLAAMAGVRPSIARPAYYCDVNVNGTAVLLEAAAAREGTRFVFASSSSVYGERRDPPFRESDRVDRPISPYAATKKAGELLCHTFHSVRGLDVTCLRYFTVYGPRQRPEMAIHKFARRIAGGEPVPVFGDGSSARDYTYVDDIVDGTIRALDRAGGYRLYNLGGSHTIGLSELIELLGREIGREVVVDRRPDQAGDVPLTSACVDRAREELGYEPRTSIEEGVRRFVSWMRGETA
jgi:UDP-glucuronate 4-epimerase